MEQTFFYILLSFIISMLWAPALISFLYKFKITRKYDTDFSGVIEERFQKVGTPIMGGLLVVVTTVILTLIFNWKNSTYIPIIVMLISAGLGGIDDVLNIYGKRPKLRTVQKQIKLAKVHKNPLMRLYYWVTLPWIAYLNLWWSLGSNPGQGLHAGEKIIIQLIIGGLVAYWLYFRMGWSTIWMPIIGNLDLGWFMPVFVIGVVMAVSNAVNISDGMDGLSSGMLLPAFIAYMFIALVQGDWTYSIFNGIIVGGLMAYLYFNIKPARFEMGDAGTLALGTTLAVVAFAQDRVILLPVIGFMFVAIIGSSLIQGIYRRLFGRRLFKMAPLHLHFQIKGWSEEKVVMRFWLFAVIFAFIGVWLSFL